MKRSILFLLAFVFVWGVNAQVKDIALVGPEYGSGHHYYGCNVDSVLQIEIANMGDTIPSEDTIFATYQINGGGVVNDTLILNLDFLPNDTIDFIFNQPYDFSALGDYNYEITISYIADTIDSNNVSNGILTHYEPIVDLGPDTIYTIHPYPIQLSAGNDTNAVYVWSDSSTGASLTVMPEGTHTYWVNMVDSNGCSASDTITIVRYYPDVAITSPTNGLHEYGCHFNSKIKIKIKNVGDVTIPSGDTIVAGYQINGAAWVFDTLITTFDMDSGSATNFYFSQQYDFSALGDYNYKYFIHFSGDTIANNDTVTGTITVYNFNIDLGVDTIYTLRPDTVVLEAPTGYDSYMWNNGFTGREMPVNHYGEYWVFVIDSNGCSASDTVAVANPAYSEYENMMNKISIYPNPNKGEFNVAVPKVFIGKTELSVMDITGKVIKTQLVNETTTHINLTKYSKGFYFVKLVNGDYSKVVKVVIK